MGELGIGDSACTFPRTLRRMLLPCIGIGTRFFLRALRMLRMLWAALRIGTRSRPSMRAFARKGLRPNRARTCMRRTRALAALEIAHVPAFRQARLPFHDA